MLSPAPETRALAALPDEIWDIATVELPDNTNWWETRETLETLDCSQNEITSLPDHFADKLDMLRECNLSHNGLTTLPPAQSWSALAAANVSRGRVRSLEGNPGLFQTPTRHARAVAAHRAGDAAAAVSLYERALRRGE